MAAKYRQLAAILRSELASLAQHGGKLDTEDELSRRYHMSRQTVRHALKLLEDEGLILRRQGSGSYVRQTPHQAHADRVAVITSSREHYFYPKILHDIQTELSEAGYGVLNFAAENRVGLEREILQQIIQTGAAGIIVEGTKSALPNPNADLYSALSQQGIPIVFLHGGYSNLPEYPRVVDDNYGGGRLLTQYLLDKGCRKIAGIFKSDDIQGPLRYQGMVETMAQAGLPIPDLAIAWFDSEDLRTWEEETRTEQLRSFIETRLRDGQAVICHNDEIAYHLIRLLTQSGRKVPEDVAVVSFDNSYYCQMGAIPITSLGHRSGRIGSAAAKLLLEQMNKLQSRTVTLEWELHKRQSG